MMARIPKPSRRLLFWNALISSLLAVLGLLLFVLIGFVLSKDTFTADGIGPCRVCRYKVMGRSSSESWTKEFKKFGIVLAGVIIYAFASAEVLLREDAVVARSNGRRLSSWVRPMTNPESRVKWKRGAACLAVVAIIVTRSVGAVFAVRLVEDKLGAGISHPISYLNTTFLYGGQVGHNLTDLNIDPRLDGSLHIANPFIAYAQLYPNDTIKVPENWANTSLYLPPDHLPTLESVMYQSTLTHSKRIVYRSRTRPEAISSNLTFTRGGYPIGNAVYSRMSTEGLGINITSYEQWSGDGIAGIPRNLEFLSLVGESWVTNVSVVCKRYNGLKMPRWADVSGEIDYYAVPQDQLPASNRSEMIITEFSGPKQYRLRKNAENDLQVFSDFDIEIYNDLRGARDTTANAELENSPVPVQTIIIPQWDLSWPSFTAIRCMYSPSEFFKAFMAFSGQPIRDYYARANLNDPKNLLIWAKSLSNDLGGKCLAPITALPAARAIHELLSEGGGPGSGSGSGGPLGLALRELALREDDGVLGQRTWQLARVLEGVLSDTAQAYFSLVRQRVERANAWPTDDQIRLPNNKKKLLFFHVERFGGGSVAGLCLLVLYLLAAAGVLLRVCVVGGLVPRFAKYASSSSEVSSHAALVVDEKAEVKGKGKEVSGELPAGEKAQG